MKKIKINLLIAAALCVSLNASESTAQKYRQKIKALNKAFTNQEVIAKFPGLAGQDAFIDKARRAANNRTLDFKKLTQDMIIALGNGSIDRKNYKKIADSNAELSNDQIRKNTGDATLTDDEINAARFQANRSRTILRNLNAAAVRTYAANWANYKEKKVIYNARSSQNNKEKKKGADALMQLNKNVPRVPAAPSVTQEAQPEQNPMALSYLLN